MSGKDSKHWLNRDGLGPLGGVLTRLSAGDQRRLESLLVELAAGIWELAGVEVVLLTADPVGVAGLDEAWSRPAGQGLAIWPGSGQPHWIDLPGGRAWSARPESPLSPDAELVQRCTEPVWGEADWPWADSAAGGTGTRAWWWTRIPCRGDGHLAIMVQAGDRPASRRRVVQALALLRLVLEPWFAFRVAQADLRQEIQRLTVENRAYSRLNLLQRRFTAMTSHEFKTPLTSISAYTDALLEHGGDPEFAHAEEFLGVIRAETGRLLRLVDRFLDYAKADYGLRLLERRPLELPPLVQDTVSALQPAAEAKHHRVEIQVADPLPKAEIDPDLIRQVLANLLGNAIKYTPPGGWITLHVSEAESCLAVRVEDDGPGIPGPDVRRVFQDFYRSAGTQDQEGTGLGLSIARNILDLHGGHIEVSRRSGGGTIFRFLVPKELTCPDPLPRRLVGRADPGEAVALVRAVVRLVAELTGSHEVALIVPDDANDWVVAGELGGRGPEGRADLLASVEATAPDLAAGRPVTWADGARLLVPLGSGESLLGCFVLGHKSSDGKYGTLDRRQSEVLAEIVRRTLAQLEPDGPEAGHAGGPPGVAKVVEAIRVLLQSRRRGVPTSSAEALDLLDRLARRLGLSEEYGRCLQFAAVLHDAGMARIEEEIVLGASPLSFDEREEVERHVEQGLELMAPLLGQADLEGIVRHHHERYDGTGYPDGQAGQAIPLGARILAIVDAWFALTTDRTYRSGLSPENALAEIRAHSGTQFDPDLVRTFAEVLPQADRTKQTPVPTGPESRGES